MSRRGWGLFALVGVLWGVPYLFMKVAVEELSTPLIVFSRVLIGALVLIPLAIYKKTFLPALKYWKYIFIYSILEMVIPWTLITSSQRDLSSGVVALLVATVPIWATFFAHYSGDTTAAHRTRVLGIGIGLVGIALIVGIESLNDVANLLSLLGVLISAFSYAWAVNLITSKAPGASGVAINGIAMGISALIFAPFALTHLPEKSPSSQAILSTVGLGLICTATAFWIFFKVLEDIGAARASLVVYPNTAIAVLLGIVLLDEKLTLAIAIGLPLVLIGSYYASRKPSATVIAA
jgi:drug/metabolite transporter (DMT)-like permease